jgi:hypothetical protein
MEQVQRSDAQADSAGWISVTRYNLRKRQVGETFRYLYGASVDRSPVLTGGPLVTISLREPAAGPTCTCRFGAGCSRWCGWFTSLIAVSAPASARCTRSLVTLDFAEGLRAPRGERRGQLRSGWITLIVPRGWAVRIDAASSNAANIHNKATAPTDPSTPTLNVIDPPRQPGKRICALFKSCRATRSDTRSRRAPVLSSRGFAFSDRT